MPIEYQYLCRTSLQQQLGGMLPLSIKHFAMRRKPKSASLRAELLQKCLFSNPTSCLIMITLHLSHSLLRCFYTNVNYPICIARYRETTTYVDSVTVNISVKGYIDMPIASRSTHPYAYIYLYKHYLV